jgi:phage terminase large subunit GpA-like protein
MNSPTVLDLPLPEGIRSAWQLDCEVFAEAVAPDADLTVSQWADANRILSEMSAEPGPWRTSRVPYTREIMDALSVSDPCQEVVFQKGTQVAGTETGNNWIGYIVDVAPGPAMMVMPTSNTGKRSSRTRLAKMIESTPSLRAKISERSRDKSNSTTLKEFPGGVLAVAGANSAAELKSMPVRFLFEDELDEYPDDVDGQGPADELAEKRTDTFVRKKIYKCSTPGKPKGKSKIVKAFKASDQRRYYVPCPHCKHEQVLRWGQVRWEMRRVRELQCAECGTISELDDAAAAPASAYVCTGCKASTPATSAALVERDTDEILDVHYECASCAEPIPEYHKTWMLDQGRWIAENPGPGRAKGFHLSALYSPLGWFSWRDAVKKRIAADKDPTGELLKVWTNTVEGEPYAEKAEQPSDLELKDRAEAFKLGTVPKGGLVLVAAIDVQADRLELAVKAFGRDEESWLVRYEVIHGDTETDVPWKAADEFLQLTFPHEYGVPMRILAVAVDSGYRTQRVYDFCRRRTHRHFIPVKGVPRPGRAILGRPSAQDVNYDGQVVKGGVQLWPIGVDTAKARIYARMKITNGGPGAMHWPLGLPDDYFKGLTAERLITTYHHGYARMTWEKDAGVRNEPLDLEVYAYAAGLYAGIARANWDRLEATLRSSAGDLFVQAEAAATLPEAESAAGEQAEKDRSRAAIAPPRSRRNWVTGFKDQ